MDDETNFEECDEIPFERDFFSLWMLIRDYPEETANRYCNWLAILRNHYIQLTDIYDCLYEYYWEEEDMKNAVKQKNVLCKEMEEFFSQYIPNEKPENLKEQIEYDELQQCRSAWNEYKEFLDWFFDPDENLPIPPRVKRIVVPYSKSLITYSQRKIEPVTVKGYISDLKALDNFLRKQKRPGLFPSSNPYEDFKLILESLNKGEEILNEDNMRIEKAKKTIKRWTSALNYYRDFIKVLIVAEANYEKYGNIYGPTKSHTNQS